MFCVENYLFHIESWINILLHFSVFPMIDLFSVDLVVELLFVGGGGGIFEGDTMKSE